MNPQKLLTIFVVGFGLAVLQVPAAGQSCGCDVSDDVEEEADDLLMLSEEEQQEVLEMHLPWGVPQGPANATNEHILHQRYYVTNHDDDLRVPLWVAYRLTREDVQHDLERTECFRRDIRLLDEEAAGFCADYNEPVFDRGHMVPNADMKRSLHAMLNTYMFSNMTPQHDKFNRRIWAWFEGYVREWAEKNGEIYVITGAVFDKDDDGQRDADSAADTVENGRVAVPTAYYKIILHEGANGFIENLSILVPHVDSSPRKRDLDKYLEQHIASIDEIEAVTGIDFLPDLDDRIQKAVEKNKAPNVWPRKSLWAKK